MAADEISSVAAEGVSVCGFGASAVGGGGGIHELRCVFKVVRYFSRVFSSLGPLFGLRGRPSVATAAWRRFVLISHGLLIPLAVTLEGTRAPEAQHAA